jgi:hypothetical protein
MAITVAFYGLTMEKIAEQVGNDVNYLTGTVQLALVTDAYTPDRDADNFWNDAEGSELANGDGYTTGGETLGGKTITFDSASDQVRWDANDVTWTFTASKTWRYGVMYVNTAGASSTDPLYSLLSWDSNQSVSTSYTLQWDAAGILYIDTT